MSELYVSSVAITSRLYKQESILSWDFDSLQLVIS